MVVLSAMAAVEVRMPNQEVEVIVNQLRTDCTLLLSDREGQEALGRILRHPKGMVLMRAIKGLSQKHIGGEFTSALASATRCCSPPESSGGYLRAFSERPTSPSTYGTRRRISP